MPIRTINNIVKYVPIEGQEPIPATTSTLQANKTQQLYPVMQKPTSILEIKKPINEAKTNRARSADAVRAIFHPPEKKTKRIQLDYRVLYTQELNFYNNNAHIHSQHKLITITRLSTQFYNYRTLLYTF